MFGAIHASGKTSNQSAFSRVRCAETILFPGCLAKHVCWSDLRADMGTLSVPDNSQIQLHNKLSLLFNQGQLMSPLTATGVNEELHMPIGPQALDEPMASRPATLRDPSTPDEIVVDRNSLTPFRSQPCAEFRGRDFHIVNSRTLMPWTGNF